MNNGYDPQIAGIISNDYKSVISLQLCKNYPLHVALFLGNDRSFSKIKQKLEALLKDRGKRRLIIMAKFLTVTMKELYKTMSNTF